MELLVLGETLSVTGTVMVILVVLHMHHTLVKEHKIDKIVVLTYQQERLLTWFGLCLIVIGYALEVFARVH